MHFCRKLVLSAIVNLWVNLTIGLDAAGISGNTFTFAYLLGSSQ